MTKKILIAKVNSVFGIKGEVKLIVYSENPHKIEKYQLFDEKENPLKLQISNKNKTVIGTSSGNPIVIVRIDGVNDRTAAEQLRGQEIFVNRQDFDDLNDDEFYYVDLIGLEVIDMDSKKIGKVTNILDHGAGGVVEIKFDDADLDEKRIENFSFKNEIFPEVNLKAGYIRIDMPEAIEIEEIK